MVELLGPAKEASCQRERSGMLSNTARPAAVEFVPIESVATGPNRFNPIRALYFTLSLDPAAKLYQ